MKVSTNLTFDVSELSSSPHKIEKDSLMVNNLKENDLAFAATSRLVRCHVPFFFLTLLQCFLLRFGVS